YERKDFGRAIQLFQESARERPLDARSLYYLGMAQAQAKHNAEAKETRNQAKRNGRSQILAEANSCKCQERSRMARAVFWYRSGRFPVSLADLRDSVAEQREKTLQVRLPVAAPSD